MKEVERRKGPRRGVSDVAICVREGAGGRRSGRGGDRVWERCSVCEKAFANAVVTVAVRPSLAGKGSVEAGGRAAAKSAAARGTVVVE